MVVQYAVFIITIIVAAFLIYLGGYMIAEKLDKPMQSIDELTKILLNRANHSTGNQEIEITIRMLIQVFDDESNDFLITVDEITKNIIDLIGDWNSGKTYSHTEQCPLELIEIMPVEDDSVKRSDGSQIIQVKYFITIPNDEPSMNWYVVNRIPASTVDAVLDSFDDDEDDTNVQVVPIGVRYDRPNRSF